MDELQELQKIKVRKSNGKVAEAEVLLCFELSKTGKKYIIYTFNEVDAQNMETFHASVVTENENGYQLDTMSDDEWKIVKEIMRDMVRDEE